MVQSLSQSELRAASARHERMSHLIVLVICLMLITAAFVFQPVRAGDRFVTVGGRAAPPMCMFNATTGIGCPGCGLTRSWVAAAHGQFGLSWNFNRVGWLIMLYTLLQAARHGAWLGMPAARRRINRLGMWLDRGMILIAGLLMCNWLINMALMFQA